MWLTAEGKHVEYAAEVFSIRETQGRLSLLCPTRRQMTRGDSLNQPTVTIVRGAA